MIKILHTADWHLDAPMSGVNEAVANALQKENRKLPDRIARLCKEEDCNLLLIAGDVFDGNISKDTLTAVKTALGSLDIPVVISPGNHDFCSPNSPYLTEDWPENVHIFKKAQIESIVFPELNCKIYGAGYEAMDCPPLLKRFRAEGEEMYKIGVFHADATTASAYCPVTKHQIQESGLDYVALGHIHKQGSLNAGDTMCLWPGCPMGRGFDELGPKGVIIATLGDTKDAKFLSLDTPRFYDEEIPAGDDPVAALASILPAIDSQDCYRVTLTGYSAPLDLDALRAAFPQAPNLTLSDNTLPLPDLWQNIDSDSLEGMVFAQLKEIADSPTESLSQRAVLAAQICRSILDGQEVVLP